MNTCPYCEHIFPSRRFIPACAGKASVLEATQADLPLERDFV